MAPKANPNVITSQNQHKTHSNSCNDVSCTPDTDKYNRKLRHANKLPCLLPSVNKKAVILHKEQR